VRTATWAVITSNRRITGLSAVAIAELVTEVGPLWHERHQARLASRTRKRAVGAGAKHRLVFVDRLLAMLVHLRHGPTHDVPACWFGVDRSTITRAVGELRPLLAERGCTVSPGMPLQTLAEVVDHLGVTGTTGIVDGTEIRVRRPAVGRKDRDKSIGARASRTQSRPRWSRTRTAGCFFCSPTRPGRYADITPARQSGLVKLLTDAGRPPVTPCCCTGTGTGGALLLDHVPQDIVEVLEGGVKLTGGGGPVRPRDSSPPKAPGAHLTFQDRLRDGFSHRPRWPAGSKLEEAPWLCELCEVLSTTMA
jgi:hypothetical protein